MPKSPRIPKKLRNPTAKRSFFRKQGIPLGVADVSLENKRQRCKAGARKQVSLVTPRILEADNQGGLKNPPKIKTSRKVKKWILATLPLFLSLQDTALAVAWQSTKNTSTQKVDSNLSALP
ncbi:hypothetical protein [Helicobacter zhangjianzhongii]|uniref:hypothetical protein n=1 Tax=Helicobacter zhangjianzhongii TaxID=2974574 RepID=UPI002552BCF1|nr:hypothetical protein [Helicobacter sp. CPD2-1]MDL0080909.1 hypothetical protein [Helicobacter sp. CPD2-1]